jgi:hypothetical protein
MRVTERRAIRGRTTVSGRSSQTMVSARGHSVWLTLSM